MPGADWLPFKCAANHRPTRTSQTEQDRAQSQSKRAGPLNPVKYCQTILYRSQTKQDPAQSQSKQARPTNPSKTKQDPAQAQSKRAGPLIPVKYCQAILYPSQTKQDPAQSQSKRARPFYTPVKPNKTQLKSSQSEPDP